jgi:Tol biopolymer transport system component
MPKVNRPPVHVLLILVASLGGCVTATPTLTPTATPTPTPSPTQVPTETPPPATPTPLAPIMGPSLVYLVESDGSNLRPIARGILPQFSGDGQYLSFVQTGSGQSVLVLYDRQSEEMRALNLHGELFHYAWSPDSAYIAAVTRQEDIYELHLIAPQSGDDVLIASAEYIMPIRWSPDSRYLAWAAADTVPAPPYSPRGDEEGTINAELAIYNVEEQQQTTLIGRPSMICSPTWSPDSTQIAFATGLQKSCYTSFGLTESGSDLFRVDLDGNALTQLTEHDDFILNVEWSPTDNLIAYIGVAEDTSTLHVIDAGNGEDRLSIGLGLPIGLAWSPDGQRLTVGGPTTAHMIDISTSTRQPLTGGVANYWPEGWSPDGGRVLVGANCCGLIGFLYVDVDQDFARHTVYDELEADRAFTAEDPTWAPDADLIAFSGFRGCRCP